MDGFKPVEGGEVATTRHLELMKAVRAAGLPEDAVLRLLEGLGNRGVQTPDLTPQTFAEEILASGLGGLRWGFRISEQDAETLLGWAGDVT